MTDLITVSYRSRATFQDDEAVIENIVKTSKTNNAVKGVTGVLLYDGDFFMQTLEGLPDNVLSLFQIVSEDSRHHDVSPFGFMTIAQRKFPGWSMQFVDKLMTSAIIPDMAHFDFKGSRIAEVHAELALRSNA